MKRKKNRSERGIALLVALFALILVAAVGLGMMFSTNGELGVNSSFRQGHLSYFAARSGLEEARDRMRYASTDPGGTGISDFLPVTGLGQAKSVLYITNGAIDPTSLNNRNAQYFDDEICHEVNNIAVIPNSPGTFNIKCPHAANSLPQAGNWAVLKAAEPIAGGGTIPYAWTRINLKMQETTSPWCVLGFGNCNPQPPGGPAADQVCYDGTREFVLADAENGDGTSGTGTTGTVNAGVSPNSSGGSGGVSLASQVAMGGMGMYFGQTGKGSSGHSSTTTGSSTAGTNSCPGTYVPPPPPATFAANSCYDVTAQPVYTLTSLAITPGGARRMLQYEIARLMIPPVPGALTMVGPNPFFGTPDSANFGVSGNDVDTNGTCGAAGLPPADPQNKPGIGTTTDVGISGESASQIASDSANTIAGALKRPDLYKGVDACATTAPDVQNVIGVQPMYNTVDGLNSVVQAVTAAADQVFATNPSPTAHQWGTDTTPPTPKITVINGDLNTDPPPGASGILLVTGAMNVSGSFNFNGTVLVIGKGYFNANGGGSGQINGALLVANIGNGSYATNPTNANLLPNLGSPYFNWNGGGTNFLQYDSCAVDVGSRHASFKVLARREVVY